MFPSESPRRFQPAVPNPVQLRGHCASPIGAPSGWPLGTQLQGTGPRPLANFLTLGSSLPMITISDTPNFGGGPREQSYIALFPTRNLSRRIDLPLSAVKLRPQGLRSLLRSVEDWQQKAIAVLAEQRVRDVESSASAEPPFVSVVWALVEGQQLRAARRLLAQLPDKPEYGRARRILRPPRTAVSNRLDTDRTADYRWLSRHARDYVGQWVAVSGGELIASAPTLKELRNALSSVSLLSKPVLHYVE